MNSRQKFTCIPCKHSGHIRQKWKQVHHGQMQSEKVYVYLPCESDPLQNVIDVFFKPFHQIS